jgi:predicted small metal-binding protein
MTRFNDPIIDQTSYNRELFEYLKKIFPDARAAQKTEYYQPNSFKRKLKASIIICPKPDCNYHCVEDRDPLLDHFLRHMKKVHHVTPSNQFVENLKGKISYLRNNNRISYIDPFIHVQWEDLFSKMH